MPLLFLPHSVDGYNYYKFRASLVRAISRRQRAACLAICEGVAVDISFCNARINKTGASPADVLQIGAFLQLAR